MLFVISGGIRFEELEFFHCQCNDLPDLKARNLELERALKLEKEKSAMAKEASDIVSKRLQLLQNSLKFLKAGIDGFSSHLDNAVNSFEANSL